MREHCNVVFHPRVIAGCKIFGHLKKCPVVRSLNGVEQRCKGTVDQQAQKAEYHTGNHRLPGVDPVLKPPRHAPSCPQEEGQHTGYTER